MWLLSSCSPAMTSEFESKTRIPNALCFRVTQQDRTWRLSIEEQEVEIIADLKSVNVISALVIDPTVFDIAIKISD